MLVCLYARTKLCVCVYSCSLKCPDVVPLIFFSSITVDEEYCCWFFLFSDPFFCAWWSGLVWCGIACIYASFFSFFLLYVFYILSVFVVRWLHLRVLNAFVCFIYPIFFFASLLHYIVLSFSIFISLFCVLLSLV